MTHALRPWSAVLRHRLRFRCLLDWCGVAFIVARFVAKRWVHTPSVAGRTLVDAESRSVYHFPRYIRLSPNRLYLMYIVDEGSPPFYAAYVVRVDQVEQTLKRCTSNVQCFELVTDDGTLWVCNVFANEIRVNGGLVLQLKIDSLVVEVGDTLQFRTGKVLKWDLRDAYVRTEKVQEEPACSQLVYLPEAKQRFGTWIHDCDLLEKNATCWERNGLLVAEEFYGGGTQRKIMTATITDGVVKPITTFTCAEADQAIGISRASELITYDATRNAIVYRDEYGRPLRSYACSATHAR